MITPSQLDELERLAKAVIDGPAAQWSSDPVLRNMGRLEYDDAIHTLFRELKPATILTMCAEFRRMRALLDSRPALNAGLTESYSVWTAQVYESDRAAFGGETKQ